jgi:hypothetical protein
MKSVHYVPAHPSTMSPVCTAENKKTGPKPRFLLRNSQLCGWRCTGVSRSRLIFQQRFHRQLDAAFVVET